MPGDLERAVAGFVDHYNHRRYHENLDNLTPADVYCGRGAHILKRREQIKRRTIEQRRRQHFNAVLQPDGPNPLLESVRRLQAGLQSFLSMRRIEARRKNASAFRLRFSQSLASLRQRLSHAMVRSTIQRLGKTTNPLT